MSIQFMTVYKKWDIILVPFPFTDLKTTKKRPALVVSPDNYNQGMDVVIAFVTSKVDQAARPGDYKIKEWDKTGLPKPSMLRMKFATLDKKLIIKTLGRLEQKDQQDFSGKLVDFFGS